MSNYESTYWQFVSGLAVAVGICIVLGSIFSACEWCGRVWQYWSVRRKLRRAGERWGGHQHQAGFDKEASDPDANRGRRLSDGGAPNLDVRRAEPDGEDSSGPLSRSARD